MTGDIAWSKVHGFGLRKIQVQVQILLFTIYMNFKGSIFLLWPLKLGLFTRSASRGVVGLTEIRK